MCGRFVRSTDSARLAEQFAARPAETPKHSASYNITPSQAILAARCDAQGQRECAWLRWGLVPSWSKGPDHRYSMINARSETVANKPAFRKAYQNRRCLIAADGFYEWQRLDKTRKQPYFIRLAGSEPFAMAGLWEYWQSSDGSEIESCAIITTTANALMADIHDRMPVILKPRGLHPLAGS